MYLFLECETLLMGYRLDVACGVLWTGPTQKSAWFSLQLQYLKIRRLQICYMFKQPVTRPRPPQAQFLCYSQGSYMPPLSSQHL